ncbi:hypothetical protein QVD17_00532 [Tagetes erecta]|uniref:Uncharacterized protein n=1 Tax=Tagetes erecta TaxID=13708 RepID=A0AAD8L3D9_TARER|nr:hypothetical protein QVD17_00532 [Tagetes erecta]
MTKGSKSYGQSSSKSPAFIGYNAYVPVKTTVSFKPSGGGEGSYQNTSRFSYGDKHSGCYGRVTNKEKASAGEFEWKNGTTGTRSEYKQSSTERYGDKNGYTEVYNEQRFRNVTYDRSNCSNKSYITYNNDNCGGPYGGYGHGSNGGGSYGGYGNGGGGSYGGGYGSDSDDGGPDCGSDYGDDDGGSYGGSESDDDGGGSYGGSEYDDDDDDGGGGSDDGYDSDY